MDTHDALICLKALFASPTRNVVVYLTGKPGCGKTAIVAQAAAAAKKSLLTIALPTCDAVDLRGLPRIDEHNKTVWSSPLPKTGEGVLLLDELSSAPPDVQVAAHHIVWMERGSDMCLPPGWHLVLTGNTASDRTVYRAPSGPLRNRLTIVHLEADIRAWERWAMDAALNPAIIGFLRWRPELLLAPEVPAEGAFPSPRAWERTGALLNLSVSASVERELIAGTIGEGAATELAAYLRTMRELPSIRAIVKNQQTADVPSSPSSLYALTTALAAYTRSEKISAMAYVRRLPAEFGLLYIRDVRDHYDLNADPDFRPWITAHKKLFAREEEE